MHLRLIGSKSKISPDIKKKVKDFVEDFVGKDDTGSFEIFFYAKSALIYLKEKHRVREGFNKNCRFVKLTVKTSLFFRCLQNQIQTF